MIGLENEKFQDLVLNHLAKLTQEITEVKSDVKDLKESQQQLKSKVDTIQTQTAELIEFKTDAVQKLDQLISDVGFIKHKEHLNEEELFKLKTNLQIVK
jgi:cell division septum initiation protein DivIVA